MGPRRREMPGRLVARLTVIVAAVAALGGIAACGGSDSGGSGGGGQKPLIGFSVRFIAGNSWVSTLAQSAVRSGKTRGYRVETTDAQGDAARQIQQMKTFINKGAKALIIEPVEDRGV